jgi:hypothetical protein
MDLIGPSSNFSNCAHRGMQHHGIGGLDAQLAKVTRQFLSGVP